MKMIQKPFWVALVGLGLAFGSAPANAGCLTGAALGATAGHFAGHHAILGGAAGCAIGHHRAKVANERSSVNSTVNNPNVNTSGSYNSNTR